MRNRKKLSIVSPVTKAFIVLATMLLSLNPVMAQQKYPATVSVNVMPPHSVYLNDYISRGSNKLTATVVFNDYNEPSWPIYLKIKIESPNLLIKTRDNYIPQKAITVLPGVPYTITGDDLYQYFDFNNIDVAGISKAELSNSGRLLEGTYNFCFEVFDYRSGKLISNRGCAAANIRLLEAPRLVSPLNETVFEINVTQNINFQWQLTEAHNIITQYKLHLYELPDVKVNADIAISNNQAIKIFESKPTSATNFLYDASYPLLQRGKKYAWRIQAIQEGNRNDFKNNGYSKAGTFYFGYPENGNIKLVHPEDNFGFSLRDEKFFRWEAPDNLTKNQSYIYDFKLVQINENQSDSDAILNNPPFHTEQSSSLTQTYGYDMMVNKRFESNTSYAWQVKAHTGEQTIASSPVNTLYGPPILEAFYAGNQVVFIKKAFGHLGDLSGEGEIKISPTGATARVNFSHITITPSGVLYMLSKGRATGIYPLPPIGLIAEYAPNGKADFVADSVIVNPSGLFLKGAVKWNFPHPTIKPNPAYITSKTSVVDFNELRLIGIVPLTDSLQYELADPYGFNLEFTEGSDIVLRGRNNYYPRLNGNVTLPKNVKDVITKRIKLPFKETHRLDFINETNVQGNPSVDLLNNARLYLQAVNYTFDFSETESAEKFTGDKEWKGVYISRANFIFDSEADKNYQLVYKKQYIKTIDATSAGPDSCWVTTSGLQFNTTKNLNPTDSVWFNKFPSFITNYRFSFQNSAIKNSYVKGMLHIPLISETREFTYTIPLSERGFQFGYLDESLDGIEFVYNENADDQKLNIRINKAVFAAKERLDMNINLEWPSLVIKLQNLEGFKVYGDTRIGFNKANGMFSLPDQTNGKIRGFPITAHILGAGSAPGLYAFSIRADVIMSADVAGPEGPPVANLYSIYNNKLLGDYARFNESYSTAASSQATQKQEEEKGLLSDLPADGTDLSQLEKKIDEQLNFSHADIVESAKAMINQTDSISETPSSSSADTTSNQPKERHLTPQQAEELHVKAQLATRILIAKYASSLNSVSKGMADKIDKITLNVNSKINDAIYTIVDSMAAKIAKNIKDASIKQTLYEVADVTKKETAGTITTNITAFSQDLKDQLNPTNAVAMLVGSAIEATVTEVVEQGVENISAEDLANKAGESLSKSAEMLGAIPKQIADKGGELLKSIDPQVLFENLCGALKELAYNKVKEVVAAKAAEAVSSLIGEEAGEAIGQFVQSLPMDLDGIGKKFKGEALKTIVADPVSVSLQTKIVSLAGYIQYTPDDPTYGNVWVGDITATLKVPVKLSFNVAYMVGKKDGLNFWFCQVRPAGAGSASTGKTKTAAELAADKKAYPLDKPAKIGPVELVGISGRLYSHMKDDGKTIIPDKGIDYGAFMNVVFFDASNHGKTLYLNVATEYIVTPDDEFVFDFKGKCMVRATAPSLEGNDCEAVAKGEVHFNYNSSKHHLVGSGSLEVKQPGVLCAKGSFAIETEPGKWYLAIGSRDKRIIFVPGCVGWSPTGWFIIDQNTAELGLGLQYSIAAKVGFDIGIVALAVRVDAGIALGFMVKVQYNPDFRLMDVGIWAELWAKVIVDYKINLFIASVKGSITLLDLYASANLTMHFYPPPKTLKGDVKGYVKLLGIVSCDFNASFSANI
jgi:hypothetical protein